MKRKSDKLEKGNEIKKKKSFKRFKLTKTDNSKFNGKKQKKEDSDFVDGEKPKWSQIKEKHKKIKIQRKLKRNPSIHNELVEAKKLFEQIRSSQCLPLTRQKHLAELTSVLKGNLSKIAMRHDMARIIQWILKLGPHEIKEQLANEITNELVLLAQNKYSNHIVKCILKSCKSPIRREIIKKYAGSVTVLLNNKLSAAIVEDMYTNYATHEEKELFKKELYGDIYKCSDGQEDLQKTLKENDILQKALLSNMKNKLLKFINKKWLFSSNLVMSVLYEYLQNCDETDKLEILDFLKTNISLLLKTKHGANIGFLIIWNATPKVKKDVVKELKSDLQNIAMTEPGSMFLLTLIDSVDDTVLMKKALLPTIIESAEELITNEFGRRAILYLFAHRDAHFFHPSYLEKLKKADTSANVKKSKEKRMMELTEACSNPLLLLIKDNPKHWFSNGSVGLITSAILKHGTGSALSSAFRSLAKFLVTPECTATGSDKTYKVIEDGGVHKALKQIIKNDQNIKEPNQGTFSLCLSEILSSKTLKDWITFNRGCFTLIFLLESGIDEVSSLIKKKFDEINLMEILADSTLKGASILLEKAKKL